MKSNVMGTYYLLDAARRLGVKKIIFASSYFTLGCGFRVSEKPYQVDFLPINEDHANRPEDTYSLSKLLDEEMFEAYARAYGIKCVALRLLGVAYPFMQRGLVSIEDVKREQAERITSGNSDFEACQYVDARDIATVCELAIEKDLDSDFEAFFTSTGSNCYDASPAEIIAAIRPDLAEMAKNIPEGENIISCKKLMDTFGYRPQYLKERP
jgi:nucleoside-diphosphate-sugar epimerase